MKFTIVCATLLFALSATAQPIADNSFLLEEAYNQPPGVVQHVQTFARDDESQWMYEFSQEWPIVSQKHQLGMSIPVVLDDQTGINGIADMTIDYRYQIVGVDGGPLAVAPRLSLIIPTGDDQKGLGDGGVGLEFNLPISVSLGSRAAAHTNILASAIPSTAADTEIRSWGFGQGIGYALTPRVNVLLEALWTRSEESAGGVTLRQNDVWISPGLRWVHDLANGLQVVPGIAVPIGAGDRAGEVELLFYLSLEHPFSRAAARAE